MDRPTGPRTARAATWEPAGKAGPGSPVDGLPGPWCASGGTGGPRLTRGFGRAADGAVTRSGEHRNGGWMTFVRLHGNISPPSRALPQDHGPERTVLVGARRPEEAERVILRNSCGLGAVLYRIRGVPVSKFTRSRTKIHLRSDIPGRRSRGRRFPFGQAKCPNGPHTHPTGGPRNGRGIGCANHRSGGGKSFIGLRGGPGSARVVPARAGARRGRPRSRPPTRRSAPW